MKIAYIILTHRLPDQLTRLIYQLRDTGDSFFIHIDDRSDRKAGRNLSRHLGSQLGNQPDIHFLKRYACYWGGFGIVKATIEGIKGIVESGVEFDRVILLSGQDYPIKQKSYIKAFFEKNCDKEFMESFILTSKNPWSEHGGSYKDLVRIMHWHFLLRSRPLHIPIERNFFQGIQPYGGSQWWCLSKKCIEYVHHFIQGNPKFVNYFKYSFIPDELFFQTIVSNSPFAEKVTGDNLTYADWQNPNPNYPAVLGKRDLDALLASPKLFARKFDGNRDTEILDLIDQSILNSATDQSLGEPAILSKPSVV
ncbi:MAG TPA: beta-1,6-N-acetylglucosaminyltransferase [Coleofasciculaceae cyanobacterium]